MITANFVDLDDQRSPSGSRKECQIVDAQTRAQVVRQRIIEAEAVLRERVRSGCTSRWSEVHHRLPGRRRVTQLVEMRGRLDRLARNGGMRSSPPRRTRSATGRSGHHRPRRYHNIVNDLQDVARAKLIFGMHVHVGIKEKEVALALANQVRYFLPHLLALTNSSPFWMGRRTGLMSNRCALFKRFPRTGIPDEFESPEELERFTKLLVKTGCIDNGKKIWWDVRTHYLYDTVEIRICDMPTNLDHTVALVALVQALMAKLYLMYRRNTGWRSYQRALLEENKWRALRYGTDAKLIDFGLSEERPLKDLARELVDFAARPPTSSGPTRTGADREDRRRRNQRHRQTRSSSGPTT
jgi:carboxylate-amine ligase